MARETNRNTSASRGRHFGTPNPEVRPARTSSRHAATPRREAAPRGEMAEQGESASRREATPRPASHARTDERRAPQRMRHQAALQGRSGAQVRAPQVRAPHATTDATARYAMHELPDMPIDTLSADPSMRSEASLDAPRPTPIEDTTAFATIRSGEGAVITNRETAGNTVSTVRESHTGAIPGAAQSRRLTAAAQKNVRPRNERLQTSKRLFAILGVAALVVVLIIGFLVIRAVNSANRAQDDGGRVERTAVAPEESVSYDDYNYSVQQGDDGVYSFVRTLGEGGEPLALFTLEGTPVQLVLCDGAYLIPENLPDGTWDVVAYTMGDGSVTSKLADADGNPVTGEGTLVSAELEGSELVLTDDAGATTRVPLS